MPRCAGLQSDNASARAPPSFVIAPAPAVVRVRWPPVRDIILERGNVKIQAHGVTSRDTVTMAARPATPAETEQRRTALEHRIKNAHLGGLTVPGGVWLELYQRSNSALLTESVQARRHAKQGGSSSKWTTTSTSNMP